MMHDETTDRLRNVDIHDIWRCLFYTPRFFSVLQVLSFAKLGKIGVLYPLHLDHGRSFQSV